MSAPGYAGQQYLLAINANTGAFVPVSAKGVVRRLVIEESPINADGTQNTLQGLIEYKIPNDTTANGFTTIFEAAGANIETTVDEVEPARIVLGSDIADRNWMGEIIGQPGQQIIGQPAAQAATVMVQLRSGTGTGTTVLVKEYT